MSEDQMMSVQTNHPPIPVIEVSYNKKFVLYSKNLLPQLQPILLFISEQAIIPIRHDFTQNQIPLDAEQERPVSVLYINLSTKYPIFKLLKAIARIFLLNEIELIFFAQILKKTEWNFNHDVILKVAHLIFPFIAYDLSIKEDNDYYPDQKIKLKSANTQREFQFKKLSLYIMLAAYSAKYYFSENRQTGDYLKEAQRYMMQFELVFKKWMNTHNNMREAFSPKVLNQTYMKVIEMSQKDELNYNIVIDLILQLSPAYTAKDKL